MKALSSTYVDTHDAENPPVSDKLDLHSPNLTDCPRQDQKLEDDTYTGRSIRCPVKAYSNLRNYAAQQRPDQVWQRGKSVPQSST